MKSLPQRIGFNALDRMYLVPETDDIHGAHFPMSVSIVVTLRHTPSPADVVEAVGRLERKFPQFRLGYTLDYERNCWRRVPDKQLDDHFTSLVHVPPSLDLEAFLSSIVRTNNSPLSLPVMILLHGDDLIIKIHHSFGDGKFMFKLMSYLVRALCDPEGLERLPDLPQHFDLPIRHIFARAPRQALNVLVEFLRGLTTYVSEYQRDMASPTEDKKLKPNVSGAEMIVRLKTIQPESIARLDKLRTSLSNAGVKISLNSLLQVLIASRLNDLGVLTGPPIYTTLVDLNRYVPGPLMFYPGNLVGQVRATGKLPIKLQEECEAIQAQIRQQLDRCGALATLPGEWLLALAGRRTYKRVYRDWLLASINTDPRIFVLSNLGNLDDDYASRAPYIDLDRGVYAGSPLMGGPPLLLIFSTIAGKGNLSITYNPQVLSDVQIDSLIAIFEGEQLPEKVTA
jgi:hypothetical protein